MLRQQIPAASALLLALALCGCSTFSGPSTIILTEKNSGSTVTASEGDTVSIHLKTNPTTGFMWFADGVPDPEVLRLASSRVEMNNVRQTELCGAPGTRVLDYKVVGPGFAGIKYNYRRSWETVPPAESFQVRVRVRVPKKGFLARVLDDDDNTPRVGSKGQIEPPLPERR